MNWREPQHNRRMHVVQNRVTKLGLLAAAFIVVSSSGYANDLPFAAVGGVDLPPPVTSTAPKTNNKAQAAAHKAAAQKKAEVQADKAKAKARNPYDIDDSAVDLKPGVPARFELPKLGMTGGKQEVIDQNVIRITGNETQTVYVSYKMPNRISTPFTNPTVVDLSDMPVTVAGQDVYISPEKGGPVGVFIRDARGIGPVASLTLIPANIPGQNLSIVFGGRGGASDGPVAGAAQQPIVKEQGHMASVVNTLSDVINNRVPAGYTSSALRVGTARVGCTLATPIRVLGGVDRNVFIYGLENVCAEPVELTEQSFFTDTTLGVAFWPKVKLEPADRSHVFILSAMPMGVQ